MKAYFAGGCFWCITPPFYEVDGVLSVASGFSGGDEENPSYEDVKAQKTGHRETICISYNPDKVSYRKLLEVFLSNVDPFDGGGQFIDRGRSYTLAVYFSTGDEEAAALEMIGALEAESGRKVRISVEKFKSFIMAEEYHQDWYRKHPEAFVCEMKASGRHISGFSGASQSGSLP